MHQLDACNLPILPSKGVMYPRDKDEWVRVFMERYWDTKALDIKELADEVDPDSFKCRIKETCLEDDDTCKQMAPLWDKPESFNYLVKLGATFMQLKDDKTKYIFWKDHELRAWYDMSVRAIFHTHLLECCPSYFSHICIAIAMFTDAKYIYTSMWFTDTINI